MNKPSIHFHSGASAVTGAFFTFHISGKVIAIDCGSLQGTDELENKNTLDFPIDPAGIDVLVITHAHADHIGRVPKLVADGFTGPIYSTRPTKQIAKVMFDDVIRIISRNNRRDPLFSRQDVEQTMSQWKEIPYHYPVSVSDDLSFTLHNAGHILGSSMVKFKSEVGNVLFTGDLGNSPDQLLPDREELSDIDFMVIESVYGDKEHETREDRIRKLEQVIEDTIRVGGTLLIPTFALERSQNLLFSLNELTEKKRIPHISVFFDSPLASGLTQIFRDSSEYFKREVRNRLVSDPDVFSFPGLVETISRNDSKSILQAPKPKIVIASAGMSVGGRILFHEAQYLDEVDTTILFIGYQAVGTVGRMIQDGVNRVSLLGREVDVRAQVITIQGFSAHADRTGLLDFIAPCKHSLKKVFCVMGDDESSNALATGIRDKYALDAYTPSDGSVEYL